MKLIKAVAFILLNRCNQAERPVDALSCVPFALYIVKVSETIKLIPGLKIQEDI